MIVSQLNCEKPENVSVKSQAEPALVASVSEDLRCITLGSTQIRISLDYLVSLMEKMMPKKSEDSAKIEAEELPKPKLTVRGNELNLTLYNLEEEIIVNMQDLNAGEDIMLTGVSSYISHNGLITSRLYPVNLTYMSSHLTSSCVDVDLSIKDVEYIQGLIKRFPKPTKSSQKKSEQSSLNLGANIDRVIVAISHDNCTYFMT